MKRDLRRFSSRTQRPGLILLVVLGMLALFSLLAVTYVVFAGQSRSASMALARSEIRGKKSHKGLMEEAIRALVRGPRSNSDIDRPPMTFHDILGDLYGTESPSSLRIRNRQFNPVVNGAPSPMAYAATAWQRPMILNGHFMRIPLEPGLPGNLQANDDQNPSVLPAAHDVLNGRIVTFPQGSGPLTGQSFRIVRYIGQMDRYPQAPTSEETLSFSQCYSITIDLNEAHLERSFSGTSGGISLAGTVEDWLQQQPPGTGPWASGVYACYRTVANGNLANGFGLLMNAAALNGHGVGVHNDGSTQMHYFGTNNSPLAMVGPEINRMPVAFQSNLVELTHPATNPIIGTRGVLSHNGTVNAGNDQWDDLYGPFEDRNIAHWYGDDRSSTWSDTDEPYDAPDYQNQYLAYTHENATSSLQVIPSFHRAALINYIVNWKNPAAWTPLEFRATLRRIELACIRPVSILVNVGGNDPIVYRSNPEFTGSNFSSNPPQLRMVLNDWQAWPTQGWGTATSPGAFRRWIMALTQGPWDVDNNLDGIYDSVFVDAGLPLETSAEGKLLKAMVAYYVEDLDGKIDVNATGNLAQTPDRQFIYANGDQYTRAVNNNAFSEFGQAARAYLPQGFGYGPAEISFRHLFTQMPQLPGETNDQFLERQEVAYRQFLLARSSTSGGPQPFPGRANDDGLSRLMHREKRRAFLHGVLPGLPVSPTGRASLGLDRLGNPLLWNHTAVNVAFPNNINGTLQITADQFLDETSNDSYEARLLTGGYFDNPFSLAEWERIYRNRDPDYPTLPKRMELGFGQHQTEIAGSNLPREITPISRHLRLPNIAQRGVSPVVERTASFLNLVNTLRAIRGDTVITPAGFRNLFPLEFLRGESMNLNRPFGNGADDNNDGQIDEPREFFQLLAQDVFQGQSANYVSRQPASYDSIVTQNTLEDYLGYNELAPQNLSQASAFALNLDPALVNYAQLNQNNQIPYTGNETRQLYARHLYVLAQLIVPEDYVFPNVDRDYFLQILENRNSQNQTTQQAAERAYVSLRSRILAQWAVNVVDFRDSDSVMTRFPYDPDPFRDRTLQNASYVWNPQDDFVVDAQNMPRNPAHTYVAWGMEQPELLLTESLATHDTRVWKDPMKTGMDERIDQYRIPEGSLFLELFAPRTTGINGQNVQGRANQNVPGVAMDPQARGRGLYVLDGGEARLNIGKLAPGNASVGQVPVWRVYVSEPRDTTNTRTLRTPRERLMSTPVMRQELTYQFPNGNLRFDSNGVDQASQFRATHSGMVFDHLVDNNERLPEPNPTNSRVIVFAQNFTPDFTNSPGVANPTVQVFPNQTGNVNLLGGQYLVVGPRDVTYFGSDENATTGFTNIPNANRIVLGQSWQSLYSSGNVEAVDAQLRFPRRPDNTALAPPLSMVAAVDSEVAAGWDPAGNSTNPEIGISVSEPFANQYYNEPTSRISTTDTTGDTGTGGQTNAPGFANNQLYQDGYWDYGMSSNGATDLDPFDDGQSGPLEHWDPDGNGSTNLADFQPQNGGNPQEWAQPGTQLDFCTAYLQRLADPDRPFDPALNPYITVDWIPIDLTVFNGEDRDEGNEDTFEVANSGRGLVELQGTGVFSPNENDSVENETLRFASRQKVGSMLNPRTLTYLNTGIGQTFYSLATQDPQATPEDTSITESFLKVQLDGDYPANANATPATVAKVRPSVASFSTFGFLNCGYQLAGLPGAGTVPNQFRGAPVDPTNSSANWHPQAPFWANRSYVNPLELMWVPLSAPGQFMQEFTASNPNANLTESPYAAAYRNDPNGNSTDATAPTAPISPANGNRAQVNRTPIMDGQSVVEAASFTPFAHLMNFVQEVPELAQSDNNLMFNPQIGANTFRMNDRISKNTSLMMMFDMVTTPSPWIDAVRFESPAETAWTNYNLSNPGGALLASENIVFAPLRAPYNYVSRHVEPGRINLNTVSETSVFHSLAANVMAPADVDFAPYGSLDVDHNGNGVRDLGTTTQGNRADATNQLSRNLAQNFTNSRRGYGLATGVYANYPGLGANPQRVVPYFDPGGGLFNPHMPTQFAGVFKPTSEAGMVPLTRNPFDPNFNTQSLENRLLWRRAEERGVLDIYSRNVPAFTTILRGAPSGSATGDFSGQGIPNDSVGVLKTGISPLMQVATQAPTQRHPMVDFQQVTRLKNLTTERSNVFAVYATIAFFEYEYDPIKDAYQLGKEYRSDRGEAQRYRGFYVIDRSKPVGYETGEDHNVEETILLRRYLKTDD